MEAQPPVTGPFPTSRSTMWLTGSQLVVIVAGISTQVAVARLLLPAGYGSFAVALSVLVWAEPFVSGGVTMALAQAVSTDLRLLPAALPWVRRVFIPYALVVWLAYSAALSVIAGALGDSRLALLMFVAGLALPPIALLAVCRDVLMGVGCSGRQAAVMSVHALLRAGCITLLAATVHSAGAALAGNAVAALGAAGVAASLLRRSTASCRHTPPAGVAEPLGVAVLRAGAPTVLLTLLTQLALTIDLWTVKRVIADAEPVGWYAAGRFVAFVPYMLASGLGLALFPALCREIGRGDRTRALALTREAFRVLIIVLVPLCAIVQSTALPLARLLFGKAFADAGLPMAVLTVGLSLFSFVGILQGVLIADRRPLANCVAAGSVSATAFVLCGALVPAYGVAGAAWATTLTGVTGALPLGVYVTRRLGAIVPLATACRVAVAAGCLYLLAGAWHAEGSGLIGEYVALAVFYALLLVGLGELRRADLAVAWTLTAPVRGALRRCGRSYPG